MRSASVVHVTHAGTSCSRPSRMPAARSHSSTVGHHRHPHVPLPFRPEERARGHDQTATFQQLIAQSSDGSPPGTFTHR